MKKLMMMVGVAVTMAMGTMAETTNTVKVTKFHQSYPYSGKATVEYTVGGTLPANAIAEITINPSFGGALLLTNASFVVTIAEDFGGVQLWENGPYWAEYNVGASKPEEYGYYFWWGDTVGYTRSGGTWTDYHYSGVTWVSSTGQQMSSSPFASCPTDGKDNSALQSAGYIDSTGNLTAAHDAATAHLGAPWRMPTDAEFPALIENCTTTWITTNGVSGRLVTGKGNYENRSIFLPAAGNCSGSYLYGPGSFGNYWSSSPDSDASRGAWYLGFDSSNFHRGGYFGRHGGRSVRPVRDGATTLSTMVTITFNANGGAVSPSLRSYAAYGTYNSLPTPMYAGYTFTGWYTESNGGTLVTSSSSVPTSGTTLYAHWIANAPGAEDLGGVQLWEGGPYWAECNVGAEKQEDYGYYFWWGDTVGYTNTGSGWISVKDGASISFSSSGMAALTYDKDNSALLSAGYIDSTGNLVSAHDAATAHLGAPWRMPTDAEISALIGNCTTTWISTNGVSGRLVTGKGSYANRSIFFPAAGYGINSTLKMSFDNYPGSYGDCWASTPDSGNSRRAWGLGLNSSYFRRGSSYRYDGRSVRPVRGFAE